LLNAACCPKIQTAGRLFTALLRRSLHNFPGNFSSDAVEDSSISFRENNGKEPMSDSVTNAQLLKVARDAALAAGEKARGMFDQPYQVASKGPRDVVTGADIAAQTVITDMILEAFPDHGFMPEEEDGDLPAEGPVLWIIDPIDGTTNYSRWQPIFCVSVAAVRNEPPLTTDKVLAAAVYDPMQDELFTAMAGGPCLLEEEGLHGRQLQTSSVADLKDAVIGLDLPLNEDTRQEMLDLINRLGHKVNVLRFLGSATLAMTWVAAGRLDGYLNLQLKPWDVAAAALLVTQAGGVVSDLSGNLLILDPDGLGCQTSNANMASYLTVKK
jgi:myo-inositol-1(or 4)-monophosphatase